MRRACKRCKGEGWINIQVMDLILHRKKWVSEECPNCLGKGLEDYSETLARQADQDYWEQYKKEVNFKFSTGTE